MKSFRPIIITFLIAIGCAQKSVFPIGDQSNDSQVFQYCGGQEWGYLKKLDAAKDSPYFSVHLENDISEKTDVIILNLALQAKSDIEFSVPSKSLQIQLDGREVYNKPIHFGFIRAEKQIWNRYSEQYTYKRIENTENDWEVRKKKYNGFFGLMALEEPFIVKIASHPFAEIKDPDIKITFSNVTDSIYIISKAIIPFGSARSKTSEISVRVPAFKVNGTVIPESRYTFHYDRERLVSNMRGAYRCASLEEIFHAGINKDSWFWWLYPRVSD